ncbi:MAG: hypothetical protein U9Q34_06920 [Elusimicrobiota bacterium]|nr:hypothetical protein [Elusimicrobiota bacterium]
MPEKIKLKDMMKFNFKQPLWKFAVLFFISIGWVYLLFLTADHFFNDNAYCSDCQENAAESSQDNASCDSSGCKK